MRKLAIRCLISAVIAGVLMASLMYMAQQPSNGPNIFTLSTLPFYMIGVYFSGSIHQPSPIPTFGSMFLFFFLIVYAALSIWSRLCRSDKDKA